MAAYEQVQKGPLKLKGVAELGVTKRKKKKKDKDNAKLLEAMGTSKKNEEEKRRGLDKRTPAQAAFEKMQEKRVRRVGRLGMLRAAGLGLRGWVLRKGPETRNRDSPRTFGGGRAVRNDLNSGEKMLRKRGRVRGWGSSCNGKPLKT
ncbi:PREDICTED: protein FAM32A [Hipposideros armiger]|uniref:Protein FAM32A n=1 Tax=Hipposideros armiger TaxID=186990 RepID=A0A8B7RAZ7_HIPAR|nr:PREDICTED: protein FAM32A [Hipposideros armiger]